ncbi:MAG: hypothetical protein WAM17_06960 [Rhodoplanes sp.]
MRRSELCEPAALEPVSDRCSEPCFALLPAVGPLFGLDLSALLGAAGPAPALPLPTPLLFEPWPIAKLVPPIKPAIAAAANRLFFLMDYLSLTYGRRALGELCPSAKRTLSA